ncbi:MAG: ferredoxin [Candidatus Micrarchaeota archaeon]
MEKIYIVEYRRHGCISATYCVEVDPRDWQLGGDVKADLVGGLEDASTGVWTKEIGEGELGDMLKAAKGCPVNVIRVRDKDSGEYLV